MRFGSAGAARINIGSVEKIDPKFEGLAQEGPAFLFAKGPGVAAGFEFACGRRSIGHAAETYAGNFEAGLTEIDVVHYFSSAGMRQAISGQVMTLSSGQGLYPSGKAVVSRQR